MNKQDWLISPLIKAVIVKSTNKEQENQSCHISFNFKSQYPKSNKQPLLTTQSNLRLKKAAFS